MEAGPMPGWLEWQHVEVEGRPAAYGVGGEGPPLVFVHGWGLSGRTYRAALKRLVARGLQVWAPTLPPNEEGGLAGYARWLDAFCAAVGIDEPVVLAGHSLGGAVAVQTAHDFSERVRGLVLVNAIGGAMVPRPFWNWGFGSRVSSFRCATRPGWCPLVLDATIPTSCAIPVRRGTRPTCARVADLSRELAALEARGLPVVVLWSHDDALITRDAFDSMCAALGSPVTLTVPGNHAWLIADPDGFGDVMTNVLSLLPDALPRGA